MNGLSELGAAEPTPEQLEQYVARSLGVPEATVESVEVETVDYSLETMTTGGRFWVHGTARVGGRREPFRIFVKIAQSVARSPVLAMIPPQFQEQVISTLPWQIEPNAYRSTLASSVPTPMRLPRCFDVIDLDDESAAMWLESIDYDDSPWDVDRYGRAARMLGAFAADRTVAAIDTGLKHPVGPQQSRYYFEGRLAGQFVGPFHTDEFWSHPLAAPAIDLRARLLSLVDDIPALLDESERLPLLNAHGDACPQNLLPADEGFVVIDWGFWTTAALAFDLTQLVISEIQLGLRPGTELPEIRSICLDGYREGLADNGIEVSAAELSRAHAIQAAIAGAITALPIELFGEPVTPELQGLAASRAESARILLDAVSF